MEAREQFPNASETELHDIAKERFNSFGVRLMNETIQLVKRMRPKGNFPHNVLLSLNSDDDCRQMGLLWVPDVLPPEHDGKAVSVQERRALQREVGLDLRRLSTAILPSIYFYKRVLLDFLTTFQRS